MPAYIKDCSRVEQLLLPILQVGGQNVLQMCGPHPESPQFTSIFRPLMLLDGYYLALDT